MPKLVVLPHAELCPDGAEFDAPAGETLLRPPARARHRDRARLREILRLHHLPRGAARRLRLARAGEEKEEDLLDKAWGLEAASRLSCQATLGDADLVIEIPKYTINYEREGGGKK